jgi:alpha-1,3/alpha-1,6-mannosyltransferase
LKKLQKLADDGEILHTTIRNTEYNTIDKSKWNDSSIIFLPDVSDQHKMELLRRSLALIYTPSFEHFGIVPVESMFARCPVIAVNNGGLLESVTQDEQNGFLCPPGDATSFATAMKYFVDAPKRASTMGENGRKRVIQEFSIDRLAYTLDKIVNQMTVTSQWDRKED